MEIIRVHENPALMERAATWFSQKWRVPYSAYVESMEASLTTKTGVPHWYLCMDGERIAGGLGLIENDFHERKDLRPNVCAVYTEKDYRGNKIFSKLLAMVEADMRALGYERLYLVTNHTGLYERVGWRYLTDVICDEGETSRMYVFEL